MTTVPVRLDEETVAEARLFGPLLAGVRTPGEALAEAWYEYLARHDAELDRLEDEARAERKKMAARAKHPAARKPKPDGGRTHA